MKQFQKNDRVNIVGGKYKGKKGTYKRPAGDGTKSAAIAIDGDDVRERTLRLSSIEKEERTTRDEILTEIAGLTKRLRELEVKVQKLE